MCRIKYRPDAAQATGIRSFYLSTEHPDLIDLTSSTIDLQDDGSAKLRFKITPQKERGLLQATIHVTNAKDPSRANFAEVLIFDIVAKVDPNYVAPTAELPQEEKDQPQSPEGQLRPEIENSERSFSVYSHHPGQGDVHATIQDLSVQVAELRSVLEGGSPTHSSFHSPRQTNQVSDDCTIAEEPVECFTSHPSLVLSCLFTPPLRRHS